MRVSAVCGRVLACANILVALCTSIWFLVNSVVAAAKSVSLMRLSAS